LASTEDARPATQDLRDDVLLRGVMQPPMCRTTVSGRNCGAGDHHGSLVGSAAVREVADAGRRLFGGVVQELLGPTDRVMGRVLVEQKQRDLDGRHRHGGAVSRR
jgi:hypothetical protein